MIFTFKVIDPEVTDFLHETKHESHPQLNSETHTLYYKVAVKCEVSKKLPSPTHKGM